MTAQVPDTILNGHPRVVFGDLWLDDIVRGDIASNGVWGARYEYVAQPRPIEARCSACWRGHIRVLGLTAAGALLLVRYEYPFSSEPPTPVEEPLVGDFFLVMRSRVFGRRTYVPFLNGRIVEDEARWLREPAGGWTFGFGEHRDTPHVEVCPQVGTGNTVCPGCRGRFSVLDRQVWDGQRHVCGQALTLFDGSGPVPAELDTQRDRFERTIEVVANPRSASALCPRCGMMFSVRRPQSWDGQRHSCGQPIVLHVDGERLASDTSTQQAHFRPRFDRTQVESRSKPILATITRAREGATVEGECPCCGRQAELRVCGARVVLCFVCYFATPRRAWDDESSKP